MLDRLVRRLRGRDPLRTVGYRKLSQKILIEAAETLISYETRIADLEAMVKSAYEEGWDHGFSVAEAWAKHREPQAWNWRASNARRRLERATPAAAPPLD
ncbi:hypothetical protein [Novosphingobium cyanobacteriorum]|uniref:Uncharacterized protein n=1 Tax=Novosphingobium cyanobacteriorum TaxID=3024215 RepID=A0ABT6CQT7_9SPHN|nr:hypothetical protein [Novosphingobium cyanobacteriorum]MDF8335550.1 hypothetical protein [Novosphingobium cyanobacteriorum]